MKKLLSILLSIILLIMTTMQSFAMSSENRNGKIYIFPDGTTIVYYLDAIGNPYRIINGEKIYVALELEHLIVTDPKILEELNQRNSMTRSSYFTFDMSSCKDDEKSKEYSVTVPLSTNTYFETSTLIYNRHHTGICIKTSEYNPSQSSKGINFIYYYYNESTSHWLNITIKNKDCSLFGFKFQHNPSTYPKGYFKISSVSTLKSCTISIYTGPFIPSTILL